MRYWNQKIENRNDEKIENNEHIIDGLNEEPIHISGSFSSVLFMLSSFACILELSTLFAIIGMFSAVFCYLLPFSTVFYLFPFYAVSI